MTFSAKLGAEFRRQNVTLTYARLRSAQAALIFGSTRGTWFHKLCKKWGVRTVLRVDGFMIPSYFDNRKQKGCFQDRRLGMHDMAFNYQLQQDLLLSDFVIYQSEFSKQMADHFLYNRRDRYDIIFNGVDLKHFYPGLKKRKKFCLLCLGALRHEYILGTILPVFDRLSNNHNIELLIIGSMDSVCQQQLKQYREANYERSKSIQVLGPINNFHLPSFINQTDILIHPRLGDCCPNTIIESMACAVPVICGSWGGAAELVGEGGLVVKTGQWTYGEEFVNGLCEAAETIISDLNNFKKRARKRAEESFDISVVAKKYAKIIGIGDQ